MSRKAHGGARTRQPQPAVLGDLELAVMEYLWDQGARDVKEVHRAVGRRRRITLNTVQSTLKRLFEKGLLRRTKVSHAFVYAPSLTREGFNERVLEQVVGRLMQGEGDSMLAAFVDLTERAGPDQLARLEELVSARLRRKGEGET